MEAELRALVRAVEGLTRRVEKLEGQNRFTTASDWMRANWWGWCSPTQPASKYVQVHGGILWWWDSAGTGVFRKLDDAPFGLGGCGAFAASGYYRYAVLQADVSADPASLRLWECATDFGTAAECEADFWANGPTENLWDEYFPLCALVLRNDGTTGTLGAVENLTLADAAQSYILVRDFRPWLHLHYHA